MHIPYHDKGVWERALDRIVASRPATIVLLGDFIDCYHVSRYDKASGHQKFEEELSVAREHLNTLLECGRRARVIYLEGNHEQRLEKYIIRNAPELSGLQSGGGPLSIPSLLGLSGRGIEWVPWGQQATVEGIALEHGDCAQAKAGYTAQSMLDRRSARRGVSAHTHRLAHVFRTVQDGVREWVESGCMQRRDSQAYRLYPDWQYGLSYLDEDDRLCIRSLEA